MPIRPVKDLQAHIAAARERERQANPPDSSAAVEMPEPQPVSPDRSRRRGHATKGPDGKWQPTGDKGWCQPPEHTRFKPGGKPGPGRPKNSCSHDTMMKRQLEKKRAVRVDGEERVIPTRELIIMTTIKDAAEGKDRNARKYALAEMHRLYPDSIAKAVSAEDINASDALTLAEFEADLRLQIREELLQELANSRPESAS